MLTYSDIATYFAKYFDPLTVPLFHAPGWLPSAMGSRTATWLALFSISPRPPRLRARNLIPFLRDFVHGIHPMLSGTPLLGSFLFKTIPAPIREISEIRGPSFGCCFAALSSLRSFVATSNHCGEV
jgi:hypothetical protein